MLADRNLTFNHGDTTIVSKPDKGPQGGVLSPLLRCFVVNDLSKGLQKEVFLVYGYADDIAILVRRNFLSALGILRLMP